MMTQIIVMVMIQTMKILNMKIPKKKILDSTTSRFINNTGEDEDISDELSIMSDISLREDDNEENAGHVPVILKPYEIPTEPEHDPSTIVGSYFFSCEF